jgi:replicative DNA helicase
VIATAFVGRVKIDVKPGWEEQGTLYVIGLSRPGTMKSALARRAFAPIVAAQRHMRTVAEEQIRHARARAEVLKAIVASLKKDLAKRVGDQDLRNQLEEAQFNLDTHEIPTLPVLMINDATPEALETVMSEQGERVSVLDSEGGGLETLPDARYGREGTSNLDLVLKAYSGSEPHDVRRVKRETKMIENPCMAIGGIVQPAIFEGIKGVSNTEERGFIQRLMVYAPKDRLGERAFRTEPSTRQDQHAYHWLVVNLVYSLWAVPRGASLTLTFSPQARELITQWQEVVEPRLAKDGDLADMAEFISKLAGKAARLAAILHVAKHSGTDADPFAEPISEETLHSALEIANHQIHHFRFVTRLSGMSPLAQLADRLVKHIVSHGLTEITRRDAQRHLKTPTADAADPVLDLLEDRGYIRATKMTRRASGPGREPSQRYEINPTLWREEK